MTLRALWDALDAHDWRYEMSDDPGVYRRGRREAELLSADARHLGDEGLAMAEAFRLHETHDHETGPRPEKPARPE